MKIIQETSTLIVVKDKNILVFSIGIIFTLTGFYIIFYLSRLWIGTFFALLSLFVILNAKITAVILDKDTNKLSFIFRKIIGKKTEEYSLNKIKEIELRVHYTSQRTKYGYKPGYSYELVFILNNKQEIPLNPGGSSIIRIMGRQIVSERSIGEKLANFLNIPFIERRPPTVNEVLSTIRKAVQ